MNFRLRLLNGTDRFLGVVLSTLLIGTTLAFGGAVWWARLAIAVLMVLFILAWLLHVLLEGQMRFLRSPLTLLGGLAVLLAGAQLVPLPARLTGRISPESHAVYARGVLTKQALADDTSIVLPEPAAVRTPISVDRPATLRWLAGALACLALFWGVAQFTDRLGRLLVVWGSLVAGFFLNTTIAVVQLVNGSGGLYGFLEPGKGPAWAPSIVDLLATPNTTVLRPLGEPREGHPAWAATVPDRPFLIGSLMGGPGAYLALGSIALPLGLAIVLQLLAPRGSREGLRSRLVESGQGSLAVLMTGLLVVSAVLIGLLAGPMASLPFAIGVLLVGLPSAWPSGLRWVGIGLTFLVVLGLGGGVLVGDLQSKLPRIGVAVVQEDFQAALTVWTDTVPIVRDFPILGTGLGTFASVYPFYKTQDQAPTTAMSSLLQWCLESGAVGMALLLIGGAWCLIRLPGSVRRVGTADRALAFGLIGAVVGFSLFSVVHWTIELAAVAVAASALGGTGNRWLAGGTDLFVERA